MSSLIACSHSPSLQPQRYNTFPEERRIIGEAISTDSVYFRYPFRVTVKDSVAIVMDLHCDEYYFKVFSYPSWHLISSFGKRGEAPEEMLSADQFQFDSTDSIWTLDANKMQIRRWALSAKNRNVALKETISLDKSLVRALDFYRTDSCFLIPGYLGNCRFLEVDFSGKPIKHIGNIPCHHSSMSEMSLPALAQAWRSFVDYNPTHNLFVMATQLGEVLELFNLKTHSHILLYGPNGEPQFMTDGTHGIPTGIMGYNNVRITDRYIYVVFQGTSFKDIGKALQQGRTIEDGGHNLYVFDLNGLPVRHYVLDRPVYGIDIDEQRHILIATCVESNQPIVKYII